MKLGYGVTSLKSEEIFRRLSFCLRKMDVEIVKTIEKVSIGCSQHRPSTELRLSYFQNPYKTWETLTTLALL
jgi:hypothetical protein